MLTSLGIVSQILLAVVIIIGVELLLSTAEAVVGWVKRVDSLAVDLISNTVDPTYQMVRVYQDPRNTSSKTLPRSANERDGLEFSYSLWLNINSSTFSSPVVANNGAPAVVEKSPATLKHIFHKGTNGMYPLLAPGVFLDEHSNSLVIYMNTFDDWRNIVVIKNVPVQKWVHLVISVRNRTMDVYVNSNVVASKTFTSFPKQNYGDVFFFNTQRRRLGPDVVPFPVQRTLDPNSMATAVTTGDLRCWSGDDVAASASQRAENIAEIYPFVDGTFTGLLSRARYYAYALSFSEINSLMREGPSTTVQSATSDQPPYMADNWWVNSYTRPMP